MRVADHGVRADAPDRQQPAQRHLDGEQRRLGVRRSGPAPARRAAADSTSRSGRSQSGSSGAHASSKAVGEHRGRGRAARRPMPARCAPWPVNRKAVRPPPARRRRRRSAAARRPRRRQGGQQLGRCPADRRPARCASAAARCASGSATSAERRRRAAGSSELARAGAACARSAVGRRAADDQPRRHRPRAAGGLGRRPSGAGGCSRMTWALVPLIPNDETPARRGRPAARARAGPRSAARPRRRTSRRAGSARRRAGCCGSTPCRIAMHHLDDAGDAGGGLGVADVGLQRAEPAAAGRARSWP